MLTLEEYHQKNLSLLSEKRRLKIALAKKDEEIATDKRLIQNMVVVLKSTRAEFRCCQKACISVTGPLLDKCTQLINQARAEMKA